MVRWGVLSNIELNDPKTTAKYLFLSVEHDGNFVDVARPVDSDFAINGPAHLAEVFQLPVNDVFPIEYDISKVAIGDSKAVKGLIHGLT